MHSRAWRALPAAACLWLALASSACSRPMERITLSVGGQAFSVEVARTEAERRQGLMNRQSLGAREGMLFVFDRDEHLEFWMKDTRVPLSIAFLSAEGKILEVVDMQPLSRKTVRSRFSSRYALELKLGALAALGALEGSLVVFPPGFRAAAP
jgi:uncharacterized protein